jgi:hypothetical protein
MVGLADEQGHPGRLVAGVLPPVPGAVLHDRVAGVQRDLGAVVEFEHDRTLEHHLEVDGVGGVHAGIGWVHVSQKAGQLRLDVGDRVLDVREVLLGGTGFRRNGEHPEAEAADGRKIGSPLRHRPVAGELRCGVTAPELEELRRRQKIRPVGFDGFVTCEHGLPGLVVSGHHSTHAHALSQ